MKRKTAMLLTGIAMLAGCTQAVPPVEGSQEKTEESVSSASESVPPVEREELLSAQDVTANPFGLDAFEFKELDFDVTYTESVQIDRMEDGKIYFQYLDDPDGTLEIDPDYILPGERLNHAGIFSIQENSFQGGSYREDDFPEDIGDAIHAELGYHLTFAGDTAYFTSGLGPHPFVDEFQLATYAIDYRNRTRKIKKVYGTTGRNPSSRPDVIPYDRDTFFLFTIDSQVWRYTVSSGEAVPVITLPQEDIRFTKAMVHGQSIWIYGYHPVEDGKKPSDALYFYEYGLDGSLKNIYLLPLELVNRMTNAPPTFSPSYIKIFPENLFYLETTYPDSCYFLQLSQGEFRILSPFQPNSHMSLFYLAPDRPQNITYFCSAVKNDCYLIEYDRHSQRIREMLLYSKTRDSNLYLKSYTMDDLGNILLCIRESQNDNTGPADQCKFYYIPRETLENHFSQYHT